MQVPVWPHFQSTTLVKNFRSAPAPRTPHEAAASALHQTVDQEDQENETYGACDASTEQ